MIWLGLGMSVMFYAGYKGAQQYSALGPAFAAARGFGQLFKPPAGPSSAATNHGTPEQAQ